MLEPLNRLDVRDPKFRNKISSGNDNRLMLGGFSFSGSWCVLPELSERTRIMNPKIHSNTGHWPKPEPIQLGLTGICPIEPLSPDVLVRNAVTLFLFEPITSRAREWLKKHLSVGAEWFGDAVVVEHRYARDLAQGMKAAKLQLNLWREPVAMPDDVTSHPEKQSPVRGAANENDFCGLKGLSILTGIPFDRCERFVRSTFPEFKVGPPPDLSENLILDLVPRLGYSASPVNTSGFRKRKPPSLAAVLGILWPRSGYAFLIVEHDSRHCLVARNWKLYDNYFPEGITRKKYPFRRIKVEAVWSISIEKQKRKSGVKQHSLPFPEKTQAERERSSGLRRSYGSRSSL